MHLPQMQHMDAVTKILRYLKGTINGGFFFAKNGHLDIVAYTDANWAGNRDSRKSTSGYFTLISGNVVTWRKKKQMVVALSSAEVQFRGMAKGAIEVIWLHKLLCKLNFPQKEAYKLFIDNQAAISISINQVQHNRRYHVEINRHFIKEKLEKQIISLPFVRFKDQLVDILTKVVSIEGFEDFFFTQVRHWRS